ncbi:hypothetical protein HanIR_Chr05g0219191 [Helianthus annuus]|nr:hypothetical protein HanIR_Chr05g0219191 [Helianthus annuus]
MSTNSWTDYSNLTRLFIKKMSTNPSSGTNYSLVFADVDNDVDDDANLNFRMSVAELDYLE